MINFILYFLINIILQLRFASFIHGWNLRRNKGNWERKFRSLCFLKDSNFKFYLIITLLSLEACTSSPRFVIRNKNSDISETNLDEYSNFEVLDTQVGTASYYADQFDGKITYSGEVYNMFGLSAAHPFYQMGTIIRVTNLSNGKSVIIPINDRMPYRSDRIIDLSLGTAQKLDMINVGITKVKVEVLQWGKGKK